MPRAEVRRASQVTEFKSMVKQFHQEGIEVLLDVVYNHTGEGNHLGPTLSFRGIDNADVLLAPAGKPAAPRPTSPAAATRWICATRGRVELVLDSLRYWVQDMHVDGFRFDIAPVLGREDDGFNPAGEFFRRRPAGSGPFAA